MKKVVYFSWCQPYPIDWAAVKASGVIVAIRTGQGTWEDELFRKHYDNAVKFGVPFILWHFWQPDMASAPQVAFLLGLVNKLPVKPKAIAWDVEPIEWWKLIDGVRVRQPDIVPPSREWAHKELLYALKETQRAGYKAGIYTRKNIFEAWTYETPEWYQFWLWIAAWYIYTGTVKPALPWKWQYYLIHQYAGGTLNALPGIGSNSVCLEYWNEDAPVDINDYVVSSDGGVIEPPPVIPPVEVNVASIHNVTVPIDQRAYLLKLETNQVVKNKDYFATWQDGFILPMGGMRIVTKADGNKVLFLGAEETFEGRCKEIAGKGYPVGGEFTIDPGALLQIGWTPNAVDYPWAENEIIKSIVDGLKDGAGNWLPVSMIVLRMMAVDAYPPTAIIGNDWQTRVFERVYDTFRYLMDNQGAPDVPIVLFCSDDPVKKLGDKTWLQYYDNGEFGQSIANRANKLYLALSKKNLLSTDTFPNFGFYSFFTEGSDPVVNYIPDGYANRLLFYEFTTGAQKCALVTDKAGVPTPISGALWCDTKTIMYHDLGIGETQPPPVEPPIEPPVIEPGTLEEMEARIIALEQDMDTVIGILKELGEKLGAL